MLSKKNSAKPVYIEHRETYAPGDWTHRVLLHRDGTLSAIQVWRNGPRAYTVVSPVTRRSAPTETLALKELQRQLVAAYDEGWERV